jgi:hypothetical protein
MMSDLPMILLIEDMHLMGEDLAALLTLLAHLPWALDATFVCQSVAAQMVDLPAHLAHSLTWDQGKEMSSSVSTLA